MSNAKTCKKYADGLEAKGLCRVNPIIPIDRRDEFLAIAEKMRKEHKEQGK